MAIGLDLGSTGGAGGGGNTTTTSRSTATQTSTNNIKQGNISFGSKSALSDKQLYIAGGIALLFVVGLAVSGRRGK